MTDDTVALFERYIEHLNEGVRSGDFSAGMQSFAPDAELVFEGTPVPVGPFHGRDAIEAAYRQSPPDDTVSIVHMHVREDGTAVARYVWSAGASPGGELFLTPRDGLIGRLVVTFDPA